MCKYCENLDCNEIELPHSTKQAMVCIEKLGDVAYIETDYNESFGYDSMYFYDRIYINYCPMCGRKIVERLEK